MDRFSERLLRWYAQHGRHDLPWHGHGDPYRIWVAEIMLQQTQVGTVTPYFERFVQRLPEIAALAAAAEDEVLHLWSGLGYYARARHLHRAARRVVAEFGGELPRDLERLVGLPGIGRSTAAAILAMAFGDRHPILDGNVKRVLARYHLVDGWPGAGAVQGRLWTLADRHTPAANVRDYTQAIMDLGATLCTRARPACERCPVAGGCRAHHEGKTAEYPAPRPRRRLPVRHARFLIAQRSDGAVLLERRPPTGIWGGLWGFPVLAEHEDPAVWCGDRGFVMAGPCAVLEVMDHQFTHFRLRITPLHVPVAAQYDTIMESDMRLWYEPHKPRRIGLAKPVADLLGCLESF